MAVSATSTGPVKQHMWTPPSVQRDLRPARLARGPILARARASGARTILVAVLAAAAMGAVAATRASVAFAAEAPALLAWQVGFS